jgi:hypothetical protein
MLATAIGNDKSASVQLWGNVADRWFMGRTLVTRSRSPFPKRRQFGSRRYCDSRFRGLPIASRKMALLSFACGEKKLTTSSSKKVSPVAPRCWAYAAR